VVLSSDWLRIYNESWFKDNYEAVSFDGPEVKVADGYEPRIMDFQIVDADGTDMTEDVLNRQGNIMLYVSKDLDNAGTDNQQAMNEFAMQAKKAGWQNVGLTNAPPEQNAAFKLENDVPYPMYTCDQTELKIVVRSNPGMVWVKDGVVQEKWSWRDAPDWSDLEKK
jgi:peroxiredoxin